MGNKSTKLCSLKENWKTSKLEEVNKHIYFHPLWAYFDCNKFNI